MPSGVWFHFSCVFRPFRGATLMAVCVCVVFNQLLYWGIRVRLKQLDNVFLALHVCWRARNPFSTACFGCAFKMHSSEAVYSVIYDQFQCTVNRVIMCMIIERKMVTHNYRFPHFWTTIKSYIILLKEHHDIFPCMLLMFSYILFISFVLIIKKNILSTIRNGGRCHNLGSSLNVWLLCNIFPFCIKLIFLLLSLFAPLHSTLSHNSQCKSDAYLPNCRKWNDLSTQLHTPLVFVAQMFLGVNGHWDTLAWPHPHLAVRPLRASTHLPKSPLSVCMCVCFHNSLVFLPFSFLSLHFHSKILLSVQFSIKLYMALAEVFVPYLCTIYSV